MTPKRKNEKYFFVNKRIRSPFIVRGLLRFIPFCAAEQWSRDTKDTGTFSACSFRSQVFAFGLLLRSPCTFSSRENSASNNIATQSTQLASFCYTKTKTRISCKTFPSRKYRNVGANFRLLAFTVLCMQSSSGLWIVFCTIPDPSWQWQRCATQH